MRFGRKYKRSEFRALVRGTYVARLQANSNVVVLDPEVADVFPNAEAVNAALRGPLRMDEPIATAASTALPPLLRTCMPTSAALASIATAMPFLAWTGWRAFRGIAVRVRAADRNHVERVFILRDAAFSIRVSNRIVVLAVDPYKIGSGVSRVTAMGRS